MSILDSVELLAKPDLLERLESFHEDVARFFLKNDSSSEKPEVLSAKVKKWKDWCSAQKTRVKVCESDVPVGVLPRRFNGSLVDIKVGGKKRTPDDALYNNNEDLRSNVARGNTILYLHDLDNSIIRYDNIIFALKKFTGGMGDEDEDQPDDNKTWLNYFLKPVSQAEKIVCTTKANGEAAHFSIRWIKDRFVLCAGSKNVHMLVRTHEDVEKYRDTRFLVAKTVASAALRVLEGLDHDKLITLVNFMHFTQVTGVFEILQPHYQHVVDLSHLSESELNFIAWTLPHTSESDSESYCALAPHIALDFAKHLGIKCIDYEVIPAEDAEIRMNQVRKGYGYEGEVLYFLDTKNNVIGLLKKKTAWYVVLRAIREKAAGALQDFKKDPNTYSKSSKAKKLSTRLDQIQKWLGFSTENLNQWISLGTGFLSWLVDQSKASNLGTDNVRGNFPTMWRRYLEDVNRSDNIEWSS